MFCCDEYRDTNFCPLCGSRLDINVTQKSLAAYLSTQKKKAESTYERRRKINPDMPEVSRHKYEKHINKWSNWLDWVTSARAS
jgi:hypothetical protein